MATQIYLDNNATTRTDPQVLEKMLPFFSEYYGNASSTNHSFGKKAAEGVETARLQVANLVGADVREIIFTSGATESINLAMKGVFNRYQSLGKHIVTCTTEHKAVLDVCSLLEKQGAEITYLPVDKNGNINLQDLKKVIRKDTILVSLMYVNNETGVVHPIEDVAKITSDAGVLFFCDATQAAGKIPISLNQTPVDMMSFSAHKMHGPKGIGALYVRKKNRRIQLAPLINGGGQENAMRGGTLNVPGIVGMGAAAFLCQKLMANEGMRLASMRDLLETSLSTIEQSYVNGLRNCRLPNVLNITFRFIKAEQLMVSLKNIAMASGSACSTGSLDPSHVLIAMGLTREDAHATLRLSLGRFNTTNEIEFAIESISKAVSVLRAESPAWNLYKQGLIE